MVLKKTPEGLGTAQGPQDGMGCPGLTAQVQRHQRQGQQQDPPVGAEQGVGQLARGLLLEDRKHRPGQQGAHRPAAQEIFHSVFHADTLSPASSRTTPQTAARSSAAEAFSIARSMEDRAPSS